MGRGEIAETAGATVRRPNHAADILDTRKKGAARLNDARPQVQTSKAAGAAPAQAASSVSLGASA